MSKPKELKEQIINYIRENGLIDYKGARVKDICDHFGIDRKTFYNWKKNSTFSTHIKEAQAEYKRNLERRAVESLIKCAEGFIIKTKQAKALLGKDNSPLKKEVTETEVYIKPSVAAIIFLLTNLNANTWKQRIVQNQEDVRTTDKGSQIDLSSLPDELVFKITDIINNYESDKKEPEPPAAGNRERSGQKKD